MRPPVFCCLAVLTLGLAGCATVSVSPGNIRPPNPVFAYNAIEAEPTPPAGIAIRDFNFSPYSVIENRSFIHRTLNLIRNSTPDERRIAIGRDSAATLSEEAAKRLGKTGLQVARIPAGSDVSLRGNFLLVTGRLTYVDEGNRFTRVGIGLGMGESRLTTEVHVFRVANGERAEVLVFTTNADSGKMPGIGGSILTVGIGGFVVAPLTIFKAVSDAISDAISGSWKIYNSQIDYLASETGEQVAYYLSQYAAAEHWIPQNKAERVHVAG
jgi:hypothetical protein